MIFKVVDVYAYLFDLIYILLCSRTLHVSVKLFVIILSTRLCVLHRKIVHLEVFNNFRLVWD